MSVPCRAIATAPPAMRRAARAFEERFGVRFSTLTTFSAEEMSALHRLDADESALMENVVVATDGDPGLIPHFDSLTRIANLSSPSIQARREYFDILQRVYSVLGDKMPREDRVVIAPEREGRILAETMGWLQAAGDFTPHAKRIPYSHGLMVGISECHRIDSASRLVIVDGAIASGATIVALLKLLAGPNTKVDIFSIHAAREGLRAILRTAAAARSCVRIHAGHVTDGLSPKFYAVAPDGGRLAVGDLGDMIDSVAAIPRQP